MVGILIFLDSYQLNNFPQSSTHSASLWAVTGLSIYGKIPRQMGQLGLPLCKKNSQLQAWMCGGDIHGIFFGKYGEVFWKEKSS